MKSRGIYIHIPFCKKKCDYCDFTSFQYNEKIIDDYLDLLFKEIDMYEEELKITDLTSIYIGGGTPSVLTIDQINKLFRKINKYRKNDIEVTFEVNPESISVDKLMALKRNGVNRISIGVQSLNNTDLNLLGRVHNSNVAIEAIKQVKALDFNYSVDFIYGFNAKRDILKELDIIMEYAPNHISLYPLEVYKHAKISEKIQEIDDGFAFEQYNEISNYLKEKKYEHYEVSNFAKKGCRSVHNSNYWRCYEYFGFGISSHGYIDSVRYENYQDFNSYRKRINKGDKPIINKQILCLNDKKEEFILLGLRLSDGISLDLYEKLFGETFHKINDTSVLKYLEKGQLILEDGYLKLSEEGNYQMNNILLALLD